MPNSLILYCYILQYSLFFIEKPTRARRFAAFMSIKNTLIISIIQIVLIQVAVKIIDMNNIKDDYVRRNLFREARLLRRLSHPNIIKLYETIKVYIYIIYKIVILLIDYYLKSTHNQRYGHGLYC